MDPTTTFCPNRHCPARGQIGQGNIGIGVPVVLDTVAEFIKVRF